MRVTITKPFSTATPASAMNPTAADIEKTVAAADAEWSQLVTDETHAIHLWHEMWRRAGKDRLTEFPAASLIGQLLRRYEVCHA